jgi:hypothetical protein
MLLLLLAYVSDPDELNGLNISPKIDFIITHGDVLCCLQELHTIFGYTLNLLFT